jgi:hypothetical protein
LKNKDKFVDYLKTEKISSSNNNGGGGSGIEVD